MVFTALEALPARRHEGLAVFLSGELHPQPIPTVRPIAEYADHVREAHVRETLKCTSFSTQALRTSLVVELHSDENSTS